MESWQCKLEYLMEEYYEKKTSDSKTETFVPSEESMHAAETLIKEWEEIDEKGKNDA